MAKLIPVPKEMAYFADHEGFTKLQAKHDDWPVNHSKEVQGFAPEMFAWLDDPDRPGEYFLHVLPYTLSSGGRRLSAVYVYISDPNLAFEFKMTFC